MNLGKRNREAGHIWERKCAKCLTLIGYPHVVTTRSESRSRDAKKIDLMNKEEGVNGQLPFAFQCKSYSKRVNYVELLAEMDSDLPKVILHRYTEKVGKRFMNKGEFAIMYIEDFYNLIEKFNRDSVMWFSKKMETKLRKNDHRGGWTDLDLKTLFMYLKEEVKELEEAISKNNNIIDESVDVANFAMMIADLHNLINLTK